MSEESNSTDDKQNKDTKNPMPEFLIWTFLSLLVTVAAMFILNTYFKLADNEVGSLGGAFQEVGSLGGAFQGTLGVAAAVAGAIVTIRLAKIAIDQAKKSNDIAARQARNDDPNYIIARETKAALSKLSAGHSIIENVYREMKVMEVAKCKIPYVAKSFFNDALTSNALIHMLTVCSDTADDYQSYLKYQATRDVGKLLGGMDKLFSDSKEVSQLDIVNDYYIQASPIMAKINNIISGLDKYRKEPSAKAHNDEWYQHYLSDIINTLDNIDIQKISGLHPLSSALDFREGFKDGLRSLITGKLSDKEHVYYIDTYPSDISTIFAINQSITAVLDKSVKFIDSEDLDEIDLRELPNGDETDIVHVLTTGVNHKGKASLFEIIKTDKIINSQHKIVLIIDGLRGQYFEKIYDELSKLFDDELKEFIDLINNENKIISDELEIISTNDTINNINKLIQIKRLLKNKSISFEGKNLKHPDDYNFNNLVNHILNKEIESASFPNGLVYIVAINYEYLTMNEDGFLGFNERYAGCNKANWLAYMLNKYSKKSNLGQDANFNK